MMIVIVVLEGTNSCLGWWYHLRQMTAEPSLLVSQIGGPHLGTHLVYLLLWLVYQCLTTTGHVVDVVVGTVEVGGLQGDFRGQLRHGLVARDTMLLLG